MSLLLLQCAGSVAASHTSAVSFITTPDIRTHLLCHIRRLHASSSLLRVDSSNLACHATPASINALAELKHASAFACCVLQGERFAHNAGIPFVVVSCNQCSALVKISC
jgi:hypothetical protein